MVVHRQDQLFKKRKKKSYLISQISATQTVQDKKNDEKSRTQNHLLETKTGNSQTFENKNAYKLIFEIQFVVEKLLFI